MGMVKKTISAKDYNGPKRLPKTSETKGHYTNKKRKRKK